MLHVLHQRRCAAVPSTPAASSSQPVSRSVGDRALPSWSVITGQVVGTLVEVAADISTIIPRLLDLVVGGAPAVGLVEPAAGIGLDPLEEAWTLAISGLDNATGPSQEVNEDDAHTSTPRRHLPEDPLSGKLETDTPGCLDALAGLTHAGWCDVSVPNAGDSNLPAATLTAVITFIGSYVMQKFHQ